MVRVAAQGFALMEAVVALALFVFLGVPLLAALTTGAATTARGGEYQLAALLLGRVADAWVRAATSGAVPAPGGAVDMEALDATGDLRFATGRGVDLDGMRYSATLAIDDAAAGLRRGRIAIEWATAGTTGAATGRLEAVRFLAASPGRPGEELP